jgi:hypothetical protein
MADFRKLGTTVNVCNGQLNDTTMEVCYTVVLQRRERMVQGRFQQILVADRQGGSGVSLKRAASVRSWQK